MDIVLDKAKPDPITKPEIEQIVKEKQEWKLIGRYLRTKGLKLFAYDFLKDKLYRVEIKSRDEISLVTDDKNKKLTPIDLGVEEASIDTRHTHFEALNWKNARKRVNRYKQKKIKELCNLREYNPDSIKLF